ncbi:MAG: hypothetical protein U0670_20080, partial [Anaerolineae bacterium]
MFKRFRLQPAFFTTLEAGVIGLFFIQAIRLLIGLLYSRVAGATALSAIDPALILPGTPIPADPQTITNELTFLGLMLALPLVALLIGQFRPMIVVAVIITAVGRALMPADTAVTVLSSAGLTVTAGLLYIALIARHRLRALPYFFVLGFAGDQLFHAFGNTFDPSWSSGYLSIQIGLSIGVSLLSIVWLIWESRRAARPPSNEQEPLAPPDTGLIPFWGAIGLAGTLFVELSLLTLPNVIAGRGSVD